MSHVNTLLLSLPRSASTWYQRQLAEEHNLTNLSEPFNYSKRKDLKTLKRDAYNKWLDPDTPCIAKIFPYQMTTGHTVEQSRRLFPDVFKHTDRTIFLIREDFPAQVRSLVIGSALNKIAGVDFHASWDDTIEFPDSPELRDLWKNIEMFLYTQMWVLGTMYKVFDHPTHRPELVYMDDLPQEGKYNRPVVFEWEPEIRTPNWRKNIFEADGTLDFANNLIL
jgi:hypothetical protein